MASFKYFADIDGQAIELDRVCHNGGNSMRASSFEGYPVGFTPIFVQGAGWTKRTPATRAVEMKSAPSRHECDARCFNATGRIMKCECSCGGKNHGRGAFACAEAA